MKNNRTVNEIASHQINKKFYDRQIVRSKIYRIFWFISKPRALFNAGFESTYFHADPGPSGHADPCGSQCDITFAPVHLWSANYSGRIIVFISIIQCRRSLANLKLCRHWLAMSWQKYRNGKKKVAGGLLCDKTQWQSGGDRELTVQEGWPIGMPVRTDFF